MLRNRVAAVVLGALALTGLGAQPAGAVAPTVETFPIMWTDMDPCTGEMHTFTGLGTLTAIANGDVMIERLVVDGTTDSGYVATGAPIRWVTTADQFKYLVEQTFRNPSTGDIFQAKVRVMDKAGEPAMEFASIRCVTGPTTYWPDE